MNKYLTLTAVLLLNINLAICQTYVSGGIFSNTLWTTSGSPYIVTGNIVVMTGATLTLQPGVEVKFDNGTNMEVRGDLIALGTSADSIIFTSSSSTPMSGIWGGINHWNTIYLDHVKITYAHIALMTTMSADFHMDNSYIAFNDTGIYNFGSNNTETIENTLFEENGIAIEEADEGNYILNCRFLNNDIGIGYVYETLISGCTFIGHTIKAVDGFGSDYIGNLFDNNNVGLRIKVFNLAYEIKNNTIINNQIGVQVRGDASLTPNTGFFNNTICNNSVYNAEISGNISVYLQNNCWCTTDSAAIANSIYDAYDNLALGIIFYTPFQTNCVSSVFENEETSNLTFYPNPCVQQGYLQTNFSLNAATIVIYDSYGKIVQYIEGVTGKSILVNHDKLNSGIYFIKVSRVDKLIGTSKLVVTKNY